MKRTRTIVQLLLLWLPLVLQAQTVVWQLQPTDYADMVRFGQDIYRVTKNDKTGLIKADGSVLVPVVADEIGGFYDHKALVTAHDGGQERILGCLTDDGRYNPFAQVYYTLKGQEFYSEGLLTVADEKGRKGYVDERGQAAFGFDKKYFRIKPFSEGYAAVSPKQNFFHLVNHEGTKVMVKLPEIGEVGQVWNAYKGKAYVIDTDNNFYLYDVNTARCETTKRLKSNEMEKDYLFRVRKDTQAGKTAPFSTLPEGEKGLQPVEQGGLWGFRQEDGRDILPCQLQQATQMEDNLSVVRLGDRLGLLRLVADTTTFALNVPKSYIEFDAGTEVDLSFLLQVPQSWSGETMQLQVSDHETGEGVAANGQDGGAYAVRLLPRASCTKTYDVSVSSAGLSLWSGQATFTLKRNVVDLQIAGLTLNGETANENDQIGGQFTISNANEEAITADLTMKASDGISDVQWPKQITLQPGESRQVTFTVTVKKDCQDQTISVSSSRGGQATLSIATLNAF